MKILALGALAFAAALAIGPTAAQAQMSPGMAARTLEHAEAGVVASVQGSSLTLQDGRHVFLHQGTVINPTGLTLAPGMHITIRGTRDGYKRFNANVIDRRGTVGYRETMRRIEAAHLTFDGGVGF
jgi:hypothetical protein